MLLSSVNPVVHHFISMGHLYHGELLNNQRVYIYIYTRMGLNGMVMHFLMECDRIHMSIHICLNGI